MAHHSSCAMMDREALDDKDNQEPSKEELQKEKKLCMRYIWVTDFILAELVLYQITTVLQSYISPSLARSMVSHSNIPILAKKTLFNIWTLEYLFKWKSKFRQHNICTQQVRALYKQTCSNTRNTSILILVLSFQIVFVNKFNLMEDILLLLFWPVSAGSI